MLFSHLAVQLRYLVLQAFNLLLLLLRIPFAVFELRLVFQDLHLEGLLIGFHSWLENLIGLSPSSCNHSFAVFFLNFSVKMLKPRSKLFTIEGDVLHDFESRCWEGLFFEVARAWRRNVVKTHSFAEILFCFVDSSSRLEAVEARSLWLSLKFIILHHPAAFVVRNIDSLHSGLVNFDGLDMECARGVRIKAFLQRYGHQLTLRWVDILEIESHYACHYVAAFVSCQVYIYFYRILWSFLPNRDVFIYWKHIRCPWRDLLGEWLAAMLEGELARKFDREFKLLYCQQKLTRFNLVHWLEYIS